MMNHHFSSEIEIRDISCSCQRRTDFAIIDRLTFNAYLLPVFFSTHSTTLPFMPTPSTEFVIVYASVIGVFLVSNGVLVPNKAFIFDKKAPSLNYQVSRQLKNRNYCI